MSSNQDSSLKFEKLRQQAEELIQKQPELSTAPPSDILELIHELKIHQAELQIQNEELQRAQTELSEIHREFENLYEFAPCGYLTLNSKGIITRANLTAVRLLGTNRQFLTGSGFSQYVAQDWHHIYTAARNTCIETLEKQSIEIPLLNKSEVPLWVRADIEAGHDESGAVILWRIVLMDISARHQAEKEKKRVEDQLRQSQKMEAIGTLAGGIAHEFNNMLGIIIGNTELALDDTPEWNPAADFIQEIRTASLRAKDVVRKLLSVARKTPESRKPIQICTIVDESLGLIRKTIPANIEIISNIVCTTETILGDPTEISQVLINLCTNSVHAMIEGQGVLEVTLETKTINSLSAEHFENIGPGDYVKLTVSDNGKGIAQNILDRIFEPYFTTKDVDEGLGMGLAVVNGIIKKHEGEIKVKSEVGKGTTVEILFPLIDEQPIQNGEDTETLKTGAGQILFVDDEASLVKMVTQMLTRSGYEVVGKTNSQEALNLFKKNSDRFDLVITDMAMPEITGEELAKQIIQVRPGIPIILCTGHSDRMDEKRATELGIKSFAMKPLGKADLINTVRNVLDQTRDKAQ